MGRPWYAFYPGDYERDTAHLSLTEHGAYRRLMDHYYSTGAALPTDVERLLRLCRAFADHEQAAVRTVLNEFFDQGLDGYHHKRIDAELTKAAEISEKRSVAGQASAAKRQHKPDTRSTSVGTNGPTDDQPSQPQPQPQPQPQEQSSAQGKARSARADDIVAAVQAYNSVAEELDWPKAQQITDRRKSALGARLHECGGIEGWTAAMEKARVSPFLRGERGRAKGHENWAPGLDFFLQQSSFTKLMEGKYDDRTSKQAVTGFDALVAGARAAAVG